jgi:hypothetical protein
MQHNMKAWLSFVNKLPKFDPNNNQIISVGPFGPGGPYKPFTVVAGDINRQEWRTTTRFNVQINPWADANPPSDLVHCTVNQWTKDQFNSDCVPYFYEFNFYFEETLWPFTLPIPYNVNTTTYNNVGVINGYRKSELEFFLEFQPNTFVLSINGGDTTNTVKYQYSGSVPAETISFGTKTVNYISSVSNINLTLKCGGAPGLAVGPFPVMSMGFQPDISNPNAPSKNAWTEGKTYSIPIYYTGTYSYKLFAQAMVLYTGGTLSITFNWVQQEANLGYQFETFGYPPVELKNGNSVTPGFYASNSYSLVPGALFQVTKLGDVNTCLLGNNLLGTTSSCLEFKSTNGLYPVSTMWSFMPNANGKMQFVVALEGSTKTCLALKVVNKAIVGFCTLNETITKNTDNIEWGAVQVYGQPVNTVIIVCRTDSANMYMDAGLTLTTITSTPLNLLFTRVPGFAYTGNPGTLQPLQFQLLPNKALTSIPSNYLINCWNRTPFGCGTVESDITNVCTLVTAPAGMAMCNFETKSSVLAPAYKEGARNFVENQCNTLYAVNKGCRTVGGTPVVAPDFCTGWGLAGLGNTCTVACAAMDNGSTVKSCSNEKVDFCQNNKAALNIGDCSCINLMNSDFKVANKGGISYVTFLDLLISDYGLDATINLDPICWWSTCFVTEAITPYETHPPCPTSLMQCINQLENNLNPPVNSADFRVTQINQCKFLPPGVPADAPLCSYKTFPILSDANTGPTNAYGASSSPFQIVIIVVLSAVCLLLLILMCLAFKKKRMLKVNTKK